MDELECSTVVSGDVSVTVPTSGRRRLGIEPGDRLHWTVDPERGRAVVRRERYGAGADLDPVDVGETDAVECTDS